MIQTLISNALKLYIFDKKALENIKKKVSWQVPFGILIALTFISLSISSYTELAQTGTDSWELITFGIIVSAIIAPIAIFLGGTIIHLLLKIVGGKAQITQTFKFYSSVAIISAFVNILISIPATFLLIQYPQSASINLISLIIISISSILIGLWVLITDIVTLARVHSISYLRSTMALLIIPLGVILILALLIIIFAILLF